jgi:hypothetical protein
MTSTLRRVAPGSFLAGLIWLSISAPLSCATGTPPPPPPKHEDAGSHKKDATAMEDTACGAIGQLCCAPPTQCDPGAFCSPDGTCKDQHPADLGQPCSSGSSCSSGVCGYTQGIADGAPPVPDGNGTPPPQGTGCTVGCYQTTPDCLSGWTCQQLTVGEGICVCTWSPEICDGQDNNCDGIIDNEPEADNYCTLMNDGIPEKCVKGMCECVTTCDAACVDVQNDDKNCGKCGHACKAKVEKCQDAKCCCAYSICDGVCVNTGGDDAANCGNCGQVCDYTCKAGNCLPVTLESSTAELGGIATDSANVYWLTRTLAGKVEVQYCPIAGCGTGGPAVLATAVQSNFDVGVVDALATSPTRVYFADEDGHVEDTLISGGTGRGTNYAGSTTGSETLVAVDSINVYFADTNTGDIYSCALGSTCPSPNLVIKAGSGLDGLAVSGSFVYFSSFNFSSEMGVVSKAPIAGTGPITTVCSSAVYSFSEAIDGLLTAGDNLYYTDGQSTIYVCSLSATMAAAATYFSDPNGPTTLATDGVNLYWGDSSTTGGTGAISKCALGTSCTKSTSILTGITSPISIAVGSTDLFWTAGTSGFYGTKSTVMKFGK